MGVAKTQHNMTVAFRGNTKSFDREMKRSQKTTKAFAGQIKKFGGMIAGAFAIGAITRYGSASLKAFDVQDKAEASLLTALKGREGAQKRLITQAQALQKITLFGDEETIRAQALIGAFVKEESQIKAIIPLVQDLATAKKMDLAGAADLVSKTLGSTTNALARYGIEVTGAVGSNERLASLSKGLSSAFEGQAQAAALAGTGGLTQLSNIWGDMRERAGKVLYEGIRPMIEGFKELMSPTKSVSQGLHDQQREANLLATQLNNTNLSEADRLKILNQLKDLAPDIVKGLNAENIEVGKLKENLRKYNAELVKKIAIQESEEVVAGQREKLGHQIAKRIQDENNLSKQLFKIHEKIAAVDQEAANRINDILLSKMDVLEKEKEINKVVGEINKRDQAHYASTNMAALLSSRIVKAKAKELGLQTELETKIGEYEDTYKRIFNLTPDAELLTKQQRDQIDNYNKLTQSSLDYSKALTKEQQKKLDDADAVNEQTINVTALETKLNDLRAERDLLAEAASENIELIPASELTKIKNLTAEITKLEGQLNSINGGGLKRNQSAPTSASMIKTGGVDVNAGKKNSMASNMGIGGMGNMINGGSLQIVTTNALAAQAAMTSFGETSLQVSSMFQEGMLGMGLSMADGLVDVFTGMTSMEDFLGGMISKIADFMGNMGKQLIITSKAAIAFKALLGNPFAGLGAGIALYAASKIFKAIVKKGPSMAAGGVVPKGYRGDKYPANLDSDEIIMPPKKLETFLNSFMQKMNPANAMANMAMASPGPGTMNFKPIPIHIMIDGELKAKGDDLVKTYNKVMLIQGRVTG